MVFLRTALLRAARLLAGLFRAPLAAHAPRALAHGQQEVQQAHSFRKMTNATKDPQQFSQSLLTHGRYAVRCTCNCKDSCPWGRGKFKRQWSSARGSKHAPTDMPGSSVGRSRSVAIVRPVYLQGKFDTGHACQHISPAIVACALHFT